MAQSARPLNGPHWESPSIPSKHCNKMLYKISHRSSRSNPRTSAADQRGSMRSSDLSLISGIPTIPDDSKDLNDLRIHTILDQQTPKSPFLFAIFSTQRHLQERRLQKYFPVHCSQWIYLICTPYRRDKQYFGDYMRAKPPPFTTSLMLPCCFLRKWYMHNKCPFSSR